MLCDTGFIVGSLIADDTDHTRCVQILKSIRTQLVTTWPCLTEAMYLVRTHEGPVAEELLRQQIERGFLALAPSTEEDVKRACALMRKYADAPMDFADASLVAAAESLNWTRILTFDRHFYAYRLHENTPFDVVN